jgi:hypothetical protein
VEVKNAMETESVQQCSIKQEFLRRTNFPTFPMAMVAIVTLAKDRKLRNHNNPTIKQSQTIAVQD